MKDTTESSILRKTKSFWSYTLAVVVSQNKLVIQKVTKKCIRETNLWDVKPHNFMMDIHACRNF